MRIRRSPLPPRNSVLPIKRWTIIPVVLFTIVSIALLVYLQRTQGALGPAHPGDVPQDATFARASVNRNNQRLDGIWISCRADNDRRTDWCQLTDAHGAIAYKGDFLPAGSVRRAPQSELRIGHFDPARGWVNGPNESFPVPVIPLKDGTLLVPVDDTLELGAQLSGDPSQVSNLGVR